MRIKNIFFYVLPKLIGRVFFSSRKNVTLGFHSKIMPCGQFHEVDIGRYSYFGYSCRVSCAQIGDFCSIADGVVIGGGGHPVEHVSTSPVFHSGRNVMRSVFYPHIYDPTKNSSIGNDVWIGLGAIVLAGVEIGHGAVIGAGSVVTKDVPAYEIWAGNPARYIKSRFRSDVVIGLLESRWWEMCDSDLKRFAPYFNSPETFLARLNER